MKRMKFCCVFLILSGSWISCNSIKTSGALEKSPPNTQSANIVQTEVKTSERILFKGESMTVIESQQVDLKQVNPIDKKTSCLKMADRKMSKALLELNFIGDTEYFEFTTEQTYNFGPEKFTVKFDGDLFARIEPSHLNELDQFATATIIRNLYMLRNGTSLYLLAIGPMSATSGMGHYYRAHLLVPLDSNRPVVEFQSISDDPRRIKMADSGAIYYAQIDFGDMEVPLPTSNHVPLIVSFFSIDNTGHRRLVTGFDLNCGDINTVMLDMPD